MEKTIEQRATIRFCWKAGFNATKIFEMIRKVYGESAVHCATVFRWYNRRVRVDLRWAEKWKTMTRTRENIARVADTLKEDCRSSCRLIAEQMGIQKTIVQQILWEYLQEWKLCAWFMPYALTAEQNNSVLITLTTLLKWSKATQTFWTQ